MQRILDTLRVPVQEVRSGCHLALILKAVNAVEDPLKFTQMENGRAKRRTCGSNGSEFHRLPSLTALLGGGTSFI